MADKMMQKAEGAAIDFAGIVISSIVMIVLGVIYFGITLWVIKVAAGWFFGPGLDANWAVLAAAVLTIAGVSPAFSGFKR